MDTGVGGGGGGRALTCNGLASHPGEVAILMPVVSCYRNWYKLWHMGHLAHVQTLPLS